MTMAVRGMLSMVIDGMLVISVKALLRGHDLAPCGRVLSCKEDEDEVCGCVG